MTGRLAGKVAFCTASGAGIGRATAIAFAREGAKVIASDIDMAKLKGLSDEGVAETHIVDARSTTSVMNTAKQIGRVDILFNAAGFVHHGTVLECSEADWDFSFDLNVKSLHRTITAFLPAMLAGGGGSIVNIASVSGSVLGVPNRYVYGATKAAVIGLTKAVAADYIKQGVRCNAICPGTIQSPSLDDRIAAQAKSSNGSIDDVRQAFVDRQPMGRLGSAEEVAAAAVYLASDESAFTTGTTMMIDGGFAL
ncbi:MAG TPA: SDR family oxidoreductase [Hyphomicrobiaceae bacterium]|nr:SDR family oxidoreductase [Hyphomicrobiaceae bacterium]